MMSKTATIPPTVAPVTAAIGSSIVIQNYKLTRNGTTVDGLDCN